MLRCKKDSQRVIKRELASNQNTRLICAKCKKSGIDVDRKKQIKTLIDRVDVYSVEFLVFLQQKLYPVLNGEYGASN